MLVRSGTASNGSFLIHRPTTVAAAAPPVVTTSVAVAVVTTSVAMAVAVAVVMAMAVAVATVSSRSNLARNLPDAKFLRIFQRPRPIVILIPQGRGIVVWKMTLPGHAGLPHVALLLDPQLSHLVVVMAVFESFPRHGAAVQ